MLLDLHRALRQDPVARISLVVDESIQLISAQRFGIVRVALQYKSVRLRSGIGREFCLILIDQIFPPFDRVMHRKMGHIEEERLVLISLHEAERFIGQSIGKILPFRRG